jgi:hypothetical protein
MSMRLFSGMTLQPSLIADVICHDRRCTWRGGEEVNLGIGGHQSARMGKDEWLTPPAILSALGPFDLDPCAPVERPWDMAKSHYTINDSGLNQEWFGRVWLNPPYGQETGRWLARLAAHGNGIALIFARVETSVWFDHIWGKATLILFLRGRLFFHHYDGKRAAHNSGAPSALIAYGEEAAARLSAASLDGKLVKP